MRSTRLNRPVGVRPNTNLYAGAEVHPQAAGATDVDPWSNLALTWIQISVWGEGSVMFRPMVKSVQRPLVPDPPSEVRSGKSKRMDCVDDPYPTVLSR